MKNTFRALAFSTAMNVFTRIWIVVAALVFAVGLVRMSKAATSVDLLSADSYAILADTTVTNTGFSVINGDLGLSPGTSVTGFPPGTLNGSLHVADAAAAQAQTDLIIAYDNAEGQGPTIPIVDDLGGDTLTPGVYNSATSIGLTGTLTLNGQGDPNAVFIFQAGSTLDTAGSSVVSLTNSAQACNVFWQVGSSATLGANSIFKGNIMALASATLTTGANVEGRVLARDGAVTLDSNVVTRATCVTPPVVPPPPPEPEVVPPLIDVLKVPTPLVLPAGGGSVTYEYAVSNIGPVAMSNVTVIDNKCAPAVFVTGDADGDSLLDLTETWTYRCTTTLTLTTTNTVTATGQANGFTAVDTANATVVVGVDMPPPLIHVVKRPDDFLLPPSGGSVTYTFTVTNPGTIPLSNVSLADDHCSPIGEPTGDTNNDNLLDMSEAWVFTCRANLSTTTINTGTAQASGNGLTAIDFSVVTVVVPASTVPGLPDAGVASK
jgi:hypothetical protein